MNLEISTLDTERFSMSVAKVNDFFEEDIKEIVDFCNQNQIRLLIARISTNNISFAQILENHDYKLMDTLVYYKFDYLKREKPQIANSAQIENISGNSVLAKEISKIARDSFRGYFGHYHADKNLDKSKCDEIYVDWAYRSCIDSKVADAVIVVNQENEIAGFVTLKIRQDNLGELILSGVKPAYQKRGCYKNLIFSGMEWLHDKGLKKIVLSTQINNIAVQKVWARLGFEMDHSFYTFHKWFEIDSSD